MKQVQKNIAVALVNLILWNSTLGVASVYASDNSILFNEVKTLRAPSTRERFRLRRQWTHSRLP